MGAQHENDAQNCLKIPPPNLAFFKFSDKNKMLEGEEVLPATTPWLKVSHIKCYMTVATGQQVVSNDTRKMFPTQETMMICLLKS